MPASTQGLLGNPLIANLSPDQQQSYAQLQQQQAIGQALLSQGLTPVDTSNRQVGGVGYRVSPLEGLSKIVQAAVGNRLATQAMGQQAQLSAQMMGNAFGANQPQQPQAASADPSQSPDAGGIDGGGSGAGVQTYPVANPFQSGAQPSAQQIGQQMVGVQPAGRAGPLTIPGYTPQQSMQLYAMLGQDGFTKLLAARTAPTPATLAAQQGGFDAAGANRAAFAHDTYTAPVQGSPGTIARNPYTGQPMYYSPDVPKGGEPLFNSGGQVVGVKALDGSLQLIGQTAAAQAGGEGSQLPYAGVDSAGNPLPVINRTAAAHGGGANQPPPIPTLPGLGGPTSGADGSNVPLPGGPVPGGGIYAAAPMGATANANAQAQGQVQTMQDSYKEARQARSTGQNALTMLDDMSSYAQTKNPALANKLYNVQGVFSTDAQLFDKGRNNLISQVSGATGMNSDAARSLVEGAIPSFGMSKEAIQTGLGQIKSQVQMRMLKGDYLSDAYANGNAPAYNQRENQFDQMMTPGAASIIRMPAGPVRNQAITAAKSNPQDAQALRWALSTGLLK